jgi:thiol-disulfide isomerase/thioredoxin
MTPRVLLVGLFALSMAAATAQTTFSDDFESYADNAYIAQSSSNWKTWSNQPGGTEDARISTEQAASGTKSLKLVSTSTGGGPTDIVLPFGQKFSSGTLVYGMKMFVESGKGAYFNLQANATVGQVWAMDVYLTQGGLFNVTTGSVSQASVPYTQGAWIDIELVLDLTNNEWKIFLDEVEIASFSNTNNSVGSINLYPVNPQGQTTYYVDDVHFEYEPFVQPNLDLSLYAAQTKTKSIAGNSQPLNLTLRNLGLTPINSADVTWSNGTESHTDNLSGLNLATNQNYVFKHSAPISVPEGEQEISISISNINGGSDENDKNDARTVKVTGIIPAPGKRVLAEEGTGTWCGWCPRGAVFMDQMAADYPDHFVGIAVHNSDPMTVAAYDQGVGAFPGFNGYPGAIVDRNAVIDPSALENSLFSRIVLPPAATLLNGAEYDEASGVLTVTVKTDFLSDVSGDWRLNVAVTEDSVTGTTSGYNQANYYAGGGSGVMGGYEAKPNPVPAAQMRYDHVARGILAGFGGLPGLLPASISAGESHVVTFTWLMPAAYNKEKMHIVSMLIQPGGQVNNVNSFSFEEAVQNGLATSAKEPLALTSLELWPNPADQQTTVNLRLNELSPVRLEVVDLFGRPVASRSYGDLQGEQWLPFDTSTLPNGVYFLRILAGDGQATRRLTVQH